MEGCGEGALGSLLPQGDGNEVCVHQPSVLWGFLLQNELAEKAVNDLAAVYGTKYTYGSIIDTICEFLPPKKSSLSSPRRCHRSPGLCFTSSPRRRGIRHHRGLGLRERGEIFLHLRAEGHGALRLPPAQLPDHPHRHRDVAGAAGHHAPRPAAPLLSPRGSAGEGNPDPIGLAPPLVSINDPTDNPTAFCYIFFSWWISIKGEKNG